MLLLSKNSCSIFEDNVNKCICHVFSTFSCSCCVYLPEHFHKINIPYFAETPSLLGTLLRLLLSYSRPYSYIGSTFSSFHPLLLLFMLTLHIYVWCFHFCSGLEEVIHFVFKILAVLLYLGLSQQSTLSLVT